MGLNVLMCNKIANTELMSFEFIWDRSKFVFSVNVIHSFISLFTNNIEF